MSADADRLVHADAAEEAGVPPEIHSPICDKPLSNGPDWRPCGCPMVTIASHGGNHRAHPGDRLVCVGCGGGRVGTDYEARQAEQADAAWWRSEERDRQP